MFEHVTLLLSFVYAIALTHLLTSSTELIWARDRVRFDGLMALWMVLAALAIVINWLSFRGLTVLRHWSVEEIGLQFVTAVIQYYTCSLLSIRPGEGAVDMRVFFERQRPAIFTAFLLLAVAAMIVNYWDRNHTEGLSPTSWIAENGLVLGMTILSLLAGWAKPRWLQWGAAVGMLCLSLYFLSIYAIPA